MVKRTPVTCLRAPGITLTGALLDWRKQLGVLRDNAGPTIPSLQSFEPQEIIYSIEVSPFALSELISNKVMQ